MSTAGEKHDKVFYATFGAVLGFLLAFTVVISIIAYALAGANDGVAPEALKRVEERLQPVSQVVTDPAALMKVSAPAAKRAPMTAAEVMTKTCNACHQSGVLNAPKVGDAAEWGKRKAAHGGLDGLVKAAIAGKGAMPPRGGDPTLTEDELKAAITLMVGS